jgi:hypothetical protein
MKPKKTILRQKKKSMSQQVQQEVEDVFEAIILQERNLLFYWFSKRFFVT